MKDRAHERAMLTGCAGTLSWEVVSRVGAAESTPCSTAWPHAGVEAHPRQRVVFMAARAAKVVGWLAAMFLAAIALTAATARWSYPGPPFDVDVEGWPSKGEFASTVSLEGVLRIVGVVKIMDGLPDSSADNGKAYEIIYDIQITNVSGKPIRDLVVGAKLDEAMRPWIFSQILVFGTGREGIDLVPGQVPYGLHVGRSTGIPNPATLDEEGKHQLRAAIQTPIWLEVSWDHRTRTRWWRPEQETYFIRLTPEEIRYEGMERLQ